MRTGRLRQTLWFVTHIGAVLVVCLHAACLIRPSGSNCPVDAECEECLENKGCGFCDPPDGGRLCMAGTSFGPLESEQCTDSDWRFTSCDEPPPVLHCAGIGSCSECARAEDCGFCPETYDCRALDHNQGCELEKDPESLVCRDDACRAIADCATCAQNDECGFCLSNMICRHRESDSDCELVTDPDSDDCSDARCRQAATCEACAEQTGCGWCMDQSVCRHRMRPNDCDMEVNPSWQICREVACRAATSCGDCIAKEDCLWCYAGDTCHYYDGYSSDRPCPSEYSIRFECPPENDCTSHHGCESCLADSKCAYCYRDISWGDEYELQSGCLVVDAAGETYGGTCYDLRGTVGDCPPPPCDDFNSCETCVEWAHCTWCNHNYYSSSCVDYDHSNDEPVDRYDCESWYPPGSDCWGAD